MQQKTSIERALNNPIAPALVNLSEAICWGFGKPSSPMFRGRNGSSCGGSQSMKQMTLIAMSALALGGCKITSTAPDSSATALGKKTCLDGTQPKGNSCATTTTTPTPTPTPTPTTTTTSSSTTLPFASPNGLKGEFDVADNFDVASTLLPTVETVPVSGDPVGAFR